jgi:hypothetical protein
MLSPFPCNNNSLSNDAEIAGTGGYEQFHKYYFHIKLLSGHNF